MTNRCFALCMPFILLASCVEIASADPCGLVPPIQWASRGRPIKRIGIQKTYVFYKDGLETIVLRPAFSGKTDEFGMLIPFPTPPAIRKVPANVFEHIAAAIDPPEVVLDLRPAARFGGAGGGGIGGGGMGGGGGGGGFGFQVAKNQVRVIRQEAVGMYEVAVLQAGSAKALKRWMELHTYRFPQGMESVCTQYIQMRWCFVAVKTKVKQKGKSDPQPGQRKIRNNLPAGATFDGHVQAMGFRFRVRSPVVPMRLSVFNSSELRNVVYLLAERSAMISQVSQGFVVRQVPGSTLLRHLTQPLPLRIIGRQTTRISAKTRRRIKMDRDPKPHNGVAAQLFAADLAAARSGRLLGKHENFEKQLVQIGEKLGLRGKEYDRELNKILTRKRLRVSRSALRDLSSMTLTVIDGAFPRKVLARQNLTFTQYNMDRKRSTPRFYDAKEFGPTPRKKGVLYLGVLQRKDRSTTQLALTAVPEPLTQPARTSLTHILPALMLFLAGTSFVGLVVSQRRYHGVSRLAILGCLVSLSLAASLAIAKEKGATESKSSSSLRILMRQLDDPQRAASAAERIVESGQKSVRALIQQGRSAKLAKRGWIIVCLGKIGGPKATRYLHRTYTNKRERRIVRVWAAAGLIQAGTSTQQLVDLAAFALRHPVVARPLTLETVRRLKKNPEQVPLLVSLLQVNKGSPTSAKQILAGGAKPLIAAMLRAKSTSVRQQAAGYLATLGTQRGTSRSVASEIAGALEFKVAAALPPWGDGPLFLPRISWPNDEAKEVVGSLIAWRLWAEIHKKTAAQRRIDNTLINGTRLTAAATFTPPFNSDFSMSQWLKSWRAVVGAKGLRQMLADQSVQKRFKEALR